MNPWFTVKQVAEILQVDDSTVYALVTAGKIRHSRVGRNIRFTTDDIALYEAATKVHPPEATAGRSRPRRRRAG